MAPPGRKPTVVSTLFKDVAGGDLKIPKVKCNFCGTMVTKNGSRMKAHIGKCKNCTDDIKHKYLKSSNTDSTVISMCESQGDDSPTDCELSETPDVTESQPSTSSASATVIHSMQPTPKKRKCQTLDMYFGSPPSQSSAKKSTLCRSRSTTPTQKIPELCLDRMSESQNVSFYMFNIIFIYHSLCFMSYNIAIGLIIFHSFLGNWTL
jgi:hypothetical protein